MKPEWIIEAEKHMGLAEIPGKSHNKTIQSWLRKLQAWWDDDETPWCGAFVAHCLEASGQFVPKHWYRAKAYLEYGEKIDSPCYGCIVVFGRTGGGHVGFVVGHDHKGRLLVLGGNQSNRVSVAPFDVGRVLGYRIPFGYQPTRPLIKITNYEKSSNNEA